MSWPLPWMACALLLSFAPLPCRAHIGSPNAVFEGTAGPYPVRVIVRPPGVVPGLAEISVRVLTNGQHQVSVLPVHWKAGLEGAPPPDVAQPVAGAPNLFQCQLWLMTAGAYSVHVGVKGPVGEGKVMVPVLSVAMHRREMPRLLAGVLLACATLLLVAASAVVGAAVRESTLTPGLQAGPRSIWLSRGAMVLTALLLGAFVTGGRAWWLSVDRKYRNNRLFRASKLDARVSAVPGHQRQLQLTIIEPSERHGRSPFIPDHGKFMHLYLVREPASDVLAHLHPVLEKGERFQTRLPPLPAGHYALYADVTRENGFSETVTNSITLEPAPASPDYVALDPDDSWATATPASAEPDGTRTISWGGLKLNLAPQAYVQNEETTLTFQLEKEGRPAPIDFYMGMLGHGVVLHRQGTVFAHLHPAGSISVASQQLFTLRAEGGPTHAVTALALEKFCRAPAWQEGQPVLRFPYEFPEPGSYRFWVQFKHQGQVHTAAFDLEVQRKR